MKCEEIGKLLSNTSTDDQKKGNIRLLSYVISTTFWVRTRPRTRRSPGGEHWPSKLSTCVATDNCGYGRVNRKLFWMPVLRSFSSCVGL
jgi:hypothetical protein